MSKFITLVLIISIVIVSAIYFALHSPNDKGDTLQTPPSPPTLSQERKQLITLFFPDSNSGLLVGEEREIERYPVITDQIKECFRQLNQGPRKPGLSPVIPAATELKEVFLDIDNGIAYVDFSPEISTNHPGGIEAELFTIYAIINTLCHNFPAIKKVQILIDSREEETLAGHLFIQLPLMPDWSLQAGRN